MTQELQPHQQRVVEEETELNDRLNKLKAFIGTPLYLSLGLNEQVRLCEQLAHMKGYSEVLNRRVNAFYIPK